MSNKRPVVPERLLRGISNERTKRLTQEVWRRLPKHDRVMLEARLSIINEVRHPRTASGVIGSAGANNANNVLNGNAAQVAKDLDCEVSLVGVPKVESDQGALFVIAHEFAHAILRHNEMSVVVESLAGPELPYSLDDMETLERWQEEHANLQAWLWGFQEEMKAIKDAYPLSARAVWDVEIEDDAP